VAPHLGQIAPVIHPSQLEQAIVIDLAGNIVERVAQEVHIAALPEHAGEDFGDRLIQARMIVGDDELDARAVPIPAGEPYRSGSRSRR
jgi:hypothetical protein